MKLQRELPMRLTVNALMANAGLTREDAIATLVALKDGLIPHTTITY